MRGFVPYAPIGRHGVVGDRRTAALVAADGTLDWLCLPDYDGDPVFASLIDARRGGWWRMGPATLGFGRQRYVDDTAVLTTTWSGERGVFELTDAMPWPETQRTPDDVSRRVVLRCLRCLGGAGDCVVELAPRDVLVADLRLEPEAHGLSVRLLGRRDVPSLAVWSTRPLRIDRRGTRAVARFRLRAGESAWVVLAVGQELTAWSARAAEDALASTVAYWRRWIGRFDLRGPHARAVARSLLTLHLLAYAPTGAMVAAPTLGLPERVGGDRNYDYRYAWIRDASLSVSGLSLMGDNGSAERYLGWLSGLSRAPTDPFRSPTTFAVGRSSMPAGCGVPEDIERPGRWWSGTALIASDRSAHSGTWPTASAPRSIAARSGGRRMDGCSNTWRATRSTRGERRTAASGSFAGISSSSRAR